MNGKRIKKFFLTCWPWLLLVLVFLLRLPSLFEPFTYADEGIYLTLGQAIRRGLVLYRDIHDNKPPLIYLLAAFSGSFFNYRLLLLAWSLATIFVFYRLAQLLFAKNRFSVLLSTSVFAILTSLPTFEGNIANAENFMLLPTIAGFYLILKFLGQAKTKSKFTFTWFLAGILFCLAVLFKVPAIFDFLAALLVCLLFINQKNLKAILAHLFSLLVGFLLPLMITFFYFGLKNSFGLYLQAAFFQNLPYLSSWGGSKLNLEGVPLLLVGRALAVLLTVILLFVFRKNLSLAVKLIIVWFSFSLFATLLSSRPYPHYLIQVLPSFSLAFGFLAFDKTKKWLKSIPVFLGLVVVVTFVSFRFWYYPNLSYLTNFYQFIFGVKPRQEYLNYFGDRTQSLYETAAFLRTHTQPEEKIFIWGTLPSLYGLAERLPVGRYTVSYHIIDFNGYQETMAALTNNPPRWLIVTQDEKRPFPQLMNFIEDNYTFFQQIREIKIFYRLPKISRL